MESTTNNKLVVPQGYREYVYNLKYLMDTRYTEQEQKQVIHRLADLLGIGKTMVKLYIKSTFSGDCYNLSQDKLQKLSNYFEVEIGDLINKPST